MITNSWWQYLWEVLFSVAGCLFFMAIGEAVLAWRGVDGGVSRSGGERRRGGGEGWRGWRRDFFCLFHGLTVGVSVYAIVMARFATVQTLVAVAYGGWIWMGRRGGRRRGKRGGDESVLRGEGEGGRDLDVVRRGGDGGGGAVRRRWREIVVASLVFVCLLHVLPESEYKQNDSFFYLKMAEAMNTTGQENVHGINNEYGSRFHGVEAYHYIEIWLSALLLRVTRFCLPGIASFRFIGYTILSVGWLFGLLAAYEQLARRKAGMVAAIFCLSTVFFLPDVVDYWPGLRHYVVYAFENNYLGRPNFRVIYLYLLPLLLSLRREPDIRDVALYSVCWCTASYLCCVVLIPAVVLLWAGSFVVRGGAAHRRFLQRWAGAALATGVVLAVFYVLLGNGVISLYYSDSPAELGGYLRRHYYFVGTTIVTSLAYIAMVVIGYTGWLWIFRRRLVVAFLRENMLAVMLMVAVIPVSIVEARMLSFEDNAYQLAFVGYIAASLLIAYIWLSMAAHFRTVGFGLAGCLAFAGGYAVRTVWTGRDAFVDITKQNGMAVYGGRLYSGQYLATVGDFVRGKALLRGGYIGDSSFYQGLYYSRRNPNVYFPPLTYIIAGEVESNYEFSLSDPAAILTGLTGDPIGAGYLERAIGRSGFYQFELEVRRAHLDRAEVVRAFIRDRKLGYLIVSGEAAMPDLQGLPVERRFRDDSTGEWFIIFK
jgi:hypothetical protein